MSKRHQSSRRKTYGRRQHELRERAERRNLPDPVELAWDEPDVDAAADRFAFLEPRTPRLRFAMGD